jgi:hypothetical protein
MLIVPGFISTPLRAIQFTTLQAVDAQIPDSSINVPSQLRGIMAHVEASVEVGQLQQLAQAKDVGVVFLDNHSATTDLQDSIKIGCSNIVHGMGIRDKGVKVAIFEKGPKDTTNLSLLGGIFQIQKTAIMRD